MLVVLHLCALFLLVALGFYVFVADPRKRAHQTFAAFIAFLAIWTIKDLIFWNFYPRDGAAGWWASASFVTALLMQYSMVVFAWVFPENARTPRRRAAILFAAGLVFIPAALFGLLWSDLGFENDRFVIELTPLAYAFVIYVYVVFVYGAVVLLRKYKTFQGTQQGQQVGAIIWGLAITGVLKTLANIAFPYFGYYGLLPLSAIFVLPGVLIYAYAILNFRLFSLQTALNQFRLFPITYKVALSIATVAILSFALFQIPITWWAFRNGMDYEAWRRYLVFSVISALVPNLLLLLLVLRTISRPLQRITLAAVEVAKGGYGTEVDLRKSNDEIGLLADSFNEMSRKMASDITELHCLNEQLIRAEKLAAMGSMAAGVAHEVNNPLASISSLVQMMRSQEGHSPETREKLKLISDQIERITRVTKDMTNFARARPAARIDGDVNDIVRTALRLASFDESFKDLNIGTDLADGLPPVLADVDRLQQVFLNLLLNARDAMAGLGTLSIKTQSRDDAVVVEIMDSGTGIPNDDIPFIFDPFFTTKPAGGGTGLGLAVCYGIITAHGGKIEAENDEATGTKFTITLPTSDKEGGKHAPTEE
ncbi:MAG: ATP-binding protein [Pyrinomonadaceae bacterium]